MMTALLIVNPSDVVNCAQAGLQFHKWKEERMGRLESEALANHLGWMKEAGEGKGRSGRGDNQLLDYLKCACSIGLSLN